MGDATRGTPNDCQPIGPGCNREGTSEIRGGRCICKPYVVGERCDRCQSESILSLIMHISMCPTIPYAVFEFDT